MSMALSIAPFYSLGKDNCINVQHNFFGHVMPLVVVLESPDADSVYITFHLSGQGDQKDI